MKTLGLIIAVVILVVVGGLGYFLIDNAKGTGSDNSEFPSTFTILISSDGTSSGATRLYKAGLTYKNNKLIFGWQKYFHDSGSPTFPSGITDICIADLETSSWKDPSGSECDITRELPLDLIKLKEKINSEEFKEIDECFHYDTCYEILS